MVRRPWISEQLHELRKKKFNDDLDNIPDVSGSNPLYVSFLLHSDLLFYSYNVY